MSLFSLVAATASKEVKLADAVWKAADHGKDGAVVSDVQSSSANDGECVTKSFVVPCSFKFPSDTKFPSDVLARKYTHLLLRPQTLIFWHQEKCDMCLDGGGGVTPM